MADVYLIRDGGTWSNDASDIWATTAEYAAANNARITSYNVCYTKLLRVNMPADLDQFW